MSLLIDVYVASVRIMRGGRTSFDCDTWAGFEPIQDREIPRPSGEIFITSGGEIPQTIRIPDGADYVDLDGPHNRLISSATGQAVMVNVDEEGRTAIQLADGRIVGARTALFLAIHAKEGFAVVRPTLPPAEPRNILPAVAQVLTQATRSGSPIGPRLDIYEAEVDMIDPGPPERWLGAMSERRFAPIAAETRENITGIHHAVESAMSPSYRLVIPETSLLYLGNVGVGDPFVPVVQLHPDDPPPYFTPDDLLAMAIDDHPDVRFAADSPRRETIRLLTTTARDRYLNPARDETPVKAEPTVRKPHVHRHSHAVGQKGFTW